MKRLTLGSGNVLVIGLSSGDLAIATCCRDENGTMCTNVLLCEKRIHEFGVNSLDALLLNKSSKQTKLLVASGGDD